MRVSVLTPMKSDKPRGCGCLGGGCAIGILIVLILGGAVFWGAWSTYNGLRSMTSPSGKAIAVFQASPLQYEAVKTKLKAFQSAYEAGQQAELNLTADEINTLIARDPDWSAMKGHVLVTMQNSRIAAQVGVPLSQVRFFEKSYFNGEASMAFTTDNGQPHPMAVSVKANGNEFPQWLIKYVLSKDFIDGLDLPPALQSSGALSNLVSIEVSEDHLIIRARKKAS